MAGKFPVNCFSDSAKASEVPVNEIDGDSGRKRKMGKGGWNGNGKEKKTAVAKLALEVGRE